MTTVNHLDLLATDAAAPREKPALLHGGGSMSVGELDDRSSALAVALVERHVGAGDRVALYLQNDPQFVIALLAVWKAGGVAVSVSPMNRTAEVDAVLAMSRATAIVADDTLWAEVARATRSRLGTVVTTSPLDFAPATGVLAGRLRVSVPGAEDLSDLCEAYAGEALAPRRTDPDSPAVLTCTSGTTGPPKGAMNTHANLLAGAQVYRDVVGITADDVIGGFAPLFHVTGLSGHIAVSLLTGAPLVLGHRFEPAAVLSAIEAHRVTFLIASITALTSLAEHPSLGERDLSSLRRLYSGGQPVLAASASRVEKALGAPVHVAYGMTETTAPTHLVPFGVCAPVGQNGALSVGQAVPGVDAVVLDGEGGAVAPLSLGEICVKGPAVIPAYFESPEESAHAFRGGWLHTGDTGYVDHDGWLFVVDRTKDQINASGYKVWPTEVEDALVAHPAVSEAAVVGVPDSYRGETVKAFVTLLPDATADAEEIRLWVKDRLAAYKAPRHIVVVQTLPKTASGKVLRRALRELPDA